MQYGQIPTEISCKTTNQRPAPKISIEPNVAATHPLRRVGAGIAGPSAKAPNNVNRSTTTAKTLTGTPNHRAQRLCNTRSQSDSGPQPITVPRVSDVHARYAEMPSAMRSRTRAKFNTEALGQGRSADATGPEAGLFVGGAAADSGAASEALFDLRDMG